MAAGFEGEADGAPGEVGGGPRAGKGKIPVPNRWYAIPEAVLPSMGKVSGSRWHHPKPLKRETVMAQNIESVDAEFVLSLQGMEIETPTSSIVFSCSSCGITSC